MDVLEGYLFSCISRKCSCFRIFKKRPTVDDFRQFLKDDAGDFKLLLERGVIDCDALRQKPCWVKVIDKVVELGMSVDSVLEAYRGCKVRIVIEEDNGR